jgi:FkbM family methyltransferase
LRDFDPAGMNFEVTNPVERHRVVNHGDETEYTHAMLSSLDVDDVLFDVGANVGLVALHAGRRCKTIAFEPDLEFRDRLLRNLSLNQGLDVEVSDVAISDADGTAVLFTDGAAGNSPSLVRQRGEASQLEVRTRSIDSLVESGEMFVPTVVKLDIEGAEILALRGAERTLSGPNAPRLLFLEVHDSFLPAFDSSAEEVLALVHHHGYTEEVYEAKRANQRHLILGRV